jgi:hypothetical protein
MDFEWIVANALVVSGKLTARAVLKASQLPAPRWLLVHRCRQCGREYFHDCMDCAFRNGGVIQEEPNHELALDLCEEQSDRTNGRLERAFSWMQVQCVAAKGEEL